nr:hypothetical protein CFP56_21659 [Quercus suber]
MAMQRGRGADSTDDASHRLDLPRKMPRQRRCGGHIWSASGRPRRNGEARSGGMLSSRSSAAALVGHAPVQSFDLHQPA